jgi:hypothetical protein
MDVHQQCSHWSSFLRLPQRKDLSIALLALHGIFDEFSMAAKLLGLFVFLDCIEQIIDVDPYFLQRLFIFSAFYLQRVSDKDAFVNTSLHLFMLLSSSLLPRSRSAHNFC